MSDEKVTCPKCGHIQDGGAECLSCGVIFTRYEESLKRKEQKEQRNGSPGRSMSVLQVVLLVIITASATYFFVKPKPQVEVAAPVIIKKAEDAGTRTDAKEYPQEVAVEQYVQDTASETSGTSIEYARQATVSIETPWGGGSGFFVSHDFIVTNRHVVEMDQAQVDEFRHKVDAASRMIELERKKVREWKQKLKKLPDGPSKEQLKIIIKESEREIAKVMPQYEEAKERLEILEHPTSIDDIKVILADGSEYYTNYMLVSDNYDLTLISISLTNHPVLPRPPENNALKQGDSVYTIGSPAGLRNTVTAGIFSGYRRDENTGDILLQTDAPINPGNSGGPLIDEDGFVRGVNTMILQNTEGIGFAIPIEKVFEDFSSSLY